jgi:hypothetical protein
MADISIIKLKVRRGTDSQRQRIILDQGELGFTTDTQRLFIGNGILSGGIVAGNIIHPFLQTNGTRNGLTDAVKGDIVNENGWLYQLSGSDYSQLSSWAFIGSKFDDVSIDYSPTRSLRIKPNGIQGDKFGAGAAYNMGGLIATQSNGLSANVDRQTLTITSTNQLSVFKIDENQIQSSTLGNGLTGGSGDKIQINAANGFGFNSGVLTLTAVPSNTVVSNSIDGSAIGAGLLLSSGKVVNTIRSNTNSFQITDGQLSLNNLIAGGNGEFSNFTVNQYGQITSLSSTVTMQLTGNATTSPLSIFNGYFEQTTLTNQSIFPAVSGNGESTANINLSSAGYIVIKTGIYGEVAIPIFKFK